jgi:3'-phosphoadenosine 5'-phosphosulfate sulfotransferase (PAPS reductase)/FAD synthetase
MEVTSHSHHELQMVSATGLQFYEFLRNCKDNYISKPINHALNLLLDAFRLYGPDRVFSSYNGGKDADIIMHLLRAVCAKYAADNKVACQPTLIYFAIDDEFPEVLTHISRSEKLFNLNIVRYDCGIVEVSILFSDVNFFLIHSKRELKSTST